VPAMIAAISERLLKRELFSRMLLGRFGIFFAKTSHGWDEIQE
jgi:predicted nucleotidyltransferase